MITHIGRSCSFASSINRAREGERDRVGRMTELVVVAVVAAVVVAACVRVCVCMVVVACGGAVGVVVVVCV